MACTLIIDNPMIPWFALPVTLGAHSSSNSWIPFYSNDTVEAVSHSFCLSFLPSTNQQFLNTQSILPFTASSLTTEDFITTTTTTTAESLLPCVAHVARSLEIRLQNTQHDLKYLKRKSWQWLPLRSRSLPPPPLSNLNIEIVHVWIGPSPLPNDYQLLVQEWQKYHHNSKIIVTTPKLYRYDSLHQACSSSYFTANNLLRGLSLTDPRSISDILRLQILYQHGGVYSDLDVWPVQSFDPLVNLAKESGAVVFGLESLDVVSNSVIVSPFPNHPFLRWLLQHLPRWAGIHGGRPASDQTGPKFLTHAIRHVLEELPLHARVDDVIVVDQKTFNPVHFSTLDGGSVMKSSQDVVRRWRREQQQHPSPTNDRDSGSSPSTGTTFAVQGWNSQIAHVPTKIRIKSVVVTTAALHIQATTDIDVFPWRGSDEIDNTRSRKWRVCAQVIGEHTAYSCQPLPISFSQHLDVHIIVSAPRCLIFDGDGNEEDGIAVRAWVQNEFGLQLSRSSQVFRNAMTTSPAESSIEVRQTCQKL